MNFKKPALGRLPTLGRLREAQEFLAVNGFPMPVFQMDIYKNGESLGIRGRKAGVGRIASLDEKIEKHGATHEVMDVQLSNKEGDKFLRFSNPIWWGQQGIVDAGETGNEIVVSLHKNDEAFDKFLASDQGRILQNILNGREDKPSLLSHIASKLLHI